MEHAKKAWGRVPKIIRQLVVVVVGVIFVVLSILTSPIPGPGGIPLFLIAIAVLATEFTWAARLRDIILHIVRTVGSWWRIHRVLGTLVLLSFIIISLSIAYMLFISK